MEGDVSLAGTNIKGDFVVKTVASDEQIRVAPESLIGKTTGVPVTLTYRQVERPVVVFRGKWQERNPDGTPWNNKQTKQPIEIHGETTDRGGGCYGGGSIDHFAGTIGSFVNKGVVIEASGPPETLFWEFHDACDGSEESRRRVCMQIAEQTGLTWTEETRTVRRLFIDRRVTANPSFESQMFEQVYGLRGNEVIRQVLPPFIPERLDFYRQRGPGPMSEDLASRESLLIHWRNGKFEFWGFTGRPLGDASYLITMLLKNVYSQDLEGDISLIGAFIDGDIVVDANASDEQMRLALESLIGKTVGVPAKLTFREVARPVIVFRGKWEAKNADGTPLDHKLALQNIEIHGDTSDRGRGERSGAGPMDGFAGNLGSWINKTIVVEASGGSSKC